MAAEIRAMTLQRIWEGLAMAVAGAAVAYVVAQYVARPIRRLSQAIQRIGVGNLELEAETRRRDEVGGLHPHSPIMFISGYTEEPVATPGETCAATNYRQKPSLPADLARRVREVLDRLAPAGR